MNPARAADRAGVNSPVADMWTHHMSRGEFDKAWTISDAILSHRKNQTSTHLPRHLQWIWDGSALHGRRVLVRCYHGLGDTIQFIRYIPLLQRIAAEVVVWVQPSLIPLLQTMVHEITFMPLHDGTPEYAYDVDVELMELPHVFRTTIDSIPADVPYLHVQPALVRDDDRLSVGVFPQAGDWDPRRSVPAAFIRSLAIRSVSLYMLARDSSLLGRNRGVRIVNGPDDMLSTAAIMKGLDLVISVDSMPAHLSAALGVPTWTLLHADADWRWLRDRADSPWYPTMRLFRQKRIGNWDDVVAELVSALKVHSRRIAATTR